ncbi:MAG: AmmeMemoRadiSam system protein A [Gammaproteobacteria bacterium]|nr:AmmeMemoRadiSam system protein A [Gammaproteobacteria bacterium]
MYNEEQRSLLLKLATDSIHNGLEYGKPLPVDLVDFDAELRDQRATFVTLHKQGQLRGCIGSLRALRPLVEDVSENAYAAAFRDPRFNPLERSELDQLELSISILSPATAMSFDSEQDLLDQLRPGVDGLILKDGRRRGTFLPSVWEQLPEKQQFLQHLKLKAGLPIEYWSESIEISRYETESFS